MEFTEKFFEKLDDEDEIEDNIESVDDHGETLHKLIFKHNNKFYETYYYRSADNGQYDYELDCPEVHQVEKLMKVWEEIK